MPEPLPDPIMIFCIGCRSAIVEYPPPGADPTEVGRRLVDQAKAEGWRDRPDWYCPRCVRELFRPRLPIGGNGVS